MNRGKFITLEGGEGAGKTTNLEFVVNYLKNRGKDVVVTREPGGTAIGESIRTLLLEQSSQPMCKETELLLIFAARTQHISETINPSLNAGKWVMCDRYIDASYAYQGGGRRIHSDTLDILVKGFVNQLQPDLTFLLDVPVEVGMTRIKNRSVPDRFESEKMNFFYRVRDAYLSRAEIFPDRIKVIDGNRGLDLIQSEISKHLDQLLSC